MKTTCPSFPELSKGKIGEIGLLQLSEHWRSETDSSIVMAISEHYMATIFLRCIEIW